MVRLILLFLCLILLAACQSLQREDVPATMRFELAAYGTEAAQIQSGAVAQRTQAAATIQVAGTQAADYFHYNNVLIATVRAVIPATPSERLVVQMQSSGGGEVGMMDEMMDGVTELSQMGIASAIDPENGCFEAQSTLFNVNEVNTLYVTALANVMRVGTRLEAVWEYNGGIMYQRSWIAQESRADLCISLAMSSDDVIFQTGSWTASLFVNDELLIQLPFELVSG